MLSKITASFFYDTCKFPKLSVYFNIHINKQINSYNFKKVIHNKKQDGLANDANDI